MGRRQRQMWRRDRRRRQEESEWQRASQGEEVGWRDPSSSEATGRGESSATWVEEYPRPRPERSRDDGQGWQHERERNIPQTPRGSFDRFPGLPDHLKPQGSRRAVSPSRAAEEEERGQNTAQVIERWLANCEDCIVKEARRGGSGAGAKATRRKNMDT